MRHLLQTVLLAPCVVVLALAGEYCNQCLADYDDHEEWHDRI